MAQGAKIRGASRIVGVETNSEKCVKGNIFLPPHSLHIPISVSRLKIGTVQQLISIEIKLLAFANCFPILKGKGCFY